MPITFEFTDTPFLTPAASGTNLYVPNITHFTKMKTLDSTFYTGYYRGDQYDTIVTYPDGSEVHLNGEYGDYITLSMGGNYTITYSGRDYDTQRGSDVPFNYYNYKFHYTILVIENRLPMKKWTATDVINRLFDICEPIRRGGEQAEIPLAGGERGGGLIVLYCCAVIERAMRVFYRILLILILLWAQIFCFVFAIFYVCRVLCQT